MPPGFPLQNNSEPSSSHGTFATPPKGLHIFIHPPGALLTGGAITRDGRSVRPEAQVPTEGPGAERLYFALLITRPLTKGISGTSASVKARRALTEKLNSGEKVNLDDESVSVVASVLKDMLFFINQKGPLTEDIFRISASVRACGALKEKLNCEDKVNWYDESVLVVASVLKYYFSSILGFFFRNIQGRVFSSDLYDKRLAVTDEGNEEEKITRIQRLLDQLPKASVLLRYLSGVLHNIEQHSASNQMTAYNLSACIAPSILWSSTSCSPGLESELTKKISLVQFLIENCFKIFGANNPSFLEESSMITTMNPDDSEKASGTVNNIMAFVRNSEPEKVLLKTQWRLPPLLLRSRPQPAKLEFLTAAGSHHALSPNRCFNWAPNTRACAN
nr:LOW QUALITY PROTEIN: T-cell activation Rho GTPase-activating protein-like [Loxodonta africana]